MNHLFKARLIEVNHHCVVATQVYLRLSPLVIQIVQQDFLPAGQDQSKVEFILLGLLLVDLSLHFLQLTLADRLVHL